MKINVLDPSVYNRISAGEVVEKPASIVKELVENSIDAGAKNIRIEIEEGGIKNITISDDGCGIEKEDLTVAFLPHATSKIKNAEDLDSILSLGFRGEALASIASVCQVKLSSKTKDSPIGYSLKVDGGNFGAVSEIARSNGTTISCSNLFFNTPVRAKFLRKPKLEESEVTHLVEKFMLSFSNIAFQYYVDGKQVYNTSSCSMSDIIYTIYGNEVYNNLVELNYEEGDIKVKGYITKPKCSKSNRTYQTLFVNNRYVENSLVSACITNIYSSFLMKGRFPVYVIMLEIPPENVDVNVHPSKREVRFENHNRIYGLLTRAVESALLSTDQIQNFMINGNKNEDEELSNSCLSQKPEMVKANENKAIGGRSFSIDLFDRNQKIFDPKEFEVDVTVSPNTLDKDDNSNQAESLDQDLKELENMSLKNKTILSSKNNSTFFFDQSGEKFTTELENEGKGFIEASVKDEMKILGTVFKTYIAIEYNEAIYFIDQHAAHERLLFDKLVKNIDENNLVKQSLLAPYTFTAGAREMQYVDGLLENLKKIGFDIEKRNNLYTITSVPFLLSYIDLSKFVDEILSDSPNLESKASDFVHSKLCQSACKHAIKAGDEITKDECAYIIEQVRKGVMLCPHGRPITLVITKHEFEKMFKRVL